MNSPVGTPATVDTENDDMTMPMARPRRSKATTSATMVCASAESTPPNRPAATRAAMRKPYPGASPQASVARANSAYSVSSRCLRSKRST